MLINDDLGAFNSITRILGRKAALGLQKRFFTLWLGLETAGIFASGNSNLLLTTPLAIAGLTTAEAAFLNQTDADGDPIDSEAQTLLVPTSKKVTAEELMNDTTTMVWDRDSSGSTTTKAPTINPHAGKWNIEWTPWLENANLTGSSNEDWYLVANPSVVAIVEIVYLNGRKVPVIQSEDADFSVLGFQWRAYWDFGIAAQDYRGAVKADAS
jgi:hypothetical protein